MELSVLKKPELVIALDIGSTYSGYAWQTRDEFETNRNEIHFNTNWGAGALQLHKTTTCILLEVSKNEEGAIDQTKMDKAYICGTKLRADDEIKIKIGHEAERVYSGHAKKSKEELRGQCYIFRGFKQLLYKKGFHRGQIVQDQIGQQLLLSDVMSLFIRALKDHCLKTLHKNGVQVDLSKTLFVVTVPTIWSAEAKQFMREAAIEAGIHKTNILLALEPEAAAIYCLHLPKGQKDMGDLGMKGQKYLVADLGASPRALTNTIWLNNTLHLGLRGRQEHLTMLWGDLELSKTPYGVQFLVFTERATKTRKGIDSDPRQYSPKIFEQPGGFADISAVQVSDTGLLDELCSPLDEQVEGQIMNDALEGQATFGWKESFNTATPVGISKVKAEFKKKVAKGTEVQYDEQSQNEQFAAMRDKFEETTTFFEKSISLENRKRMFNSRLMSNSHQNETCGEVYKTIRKVLIREEAKDLKTVVLVGGLPVSRIVVDGLRQMITKYFPEVKVFVPSYRFKTVLKGAVLFGHDPMIFRSRISRETFGLDTSHIFDSTIHDENKKWRNEERGDYYCKDIFSVHIRKGQSVALYSKQPVRKYIPLSKTQRVLGLPIYRSTSLRPRYVTDDDCEQIGKITVELPETTSEIEREVEVCMIYGGTELSVIATDNVSGAECNTDIMFGSF